MNFLHVMEWKLGGKTVGPSLQFVRVGATSSPSSRAFLSLLGVRVNFHLEPAGAKTAEGGRGLPTAGLGNIEPQPALVRGNWFCEGQSRHRGLGRGSQDVCRSVLQVGSGLQLVYGVEVEHVVVLLLHVLGRHQAQLLVHQGLRHHVHVGAGVGIVGSLAQGKCGV